MGNKKMLEIICKGKKRRDTNVKKLGGIFINRDDVGKETKNINKKKRKKDIDSMNNNNDNNNDDNEETKSKRTSKSLMGANHTQKKLEMKKGNKKHASTHNKKLRGFSVNALRDMSKNLTIAIADEVVATHETAAIPSLVYSLGNMKADWNSLDDDVIAALSGALIDIMDSQMLSERLTANTLHGLCSMNAKWKSLDPQLQKSLLDQLLYISDDLGEQGVSMAFLSLAKLEVNWESDLSSELKEQLRRSIYKQVQLGEHALSSLLYGLGKMGRHFDDLHPQVLSTLKEAIVVCHIWDKCTTQGVTNSLYGLALMSARWDGLSSSVRMALMKEIKAVA